MRGRKQKFLISVALAVMGIFLFFNFCFSADSDIVINEIGAYEPDGYEWIEIYNKGVSAVDMTGWKFYENSTNHGLSLYQGADLIIDPGEYAVIADVAANIASSTSFIGTLIDSSWGTLNESGELIGLRTDSSASSTVESFTYISAHNYSLERADPNLNDYSSLNWQEHTSGNTVGFQNSNYGTVATSTTYNPSDVVINEFVSDPASGQNEWIELYNNTASVIDLTNWTIEDGVKTILTLSGSISTNGFLVFELSSSKLNNTGDRIILKDTTGQIIDSVSYGSWDDGNVSDNAPKADDPDSTARNTDGVDTNIDNNDFSKSSNPTKGAVNDFNQLSQSSPPPAPANNSSPPRFKASDVVINELVSDPKDDEEEWVELYNNTGLVIELDDWQLLDGGERATKMSGQIMPWDFFVVKGIAGNLNNMGDALVLKDPSGQEIDSVVYGSWDGGNVSDNAPKAKDPNSLIRKVDGLDTNNDKNDFVITSQITRGASNIVELAIETVKVNNANVIINEILPNPEGSDNENEFIELKNIGSEPVELLGWQLGDATARRYVFSTSTVIEPNGLFVIYRSNSKIALNNTGGESINLYLPDKTLADSISYIDKAPENESYSRDEFGLWFWSQKMTPGEENIIEVANQPPEAVIEVNHEEAEVGAEITFDASDSSDDSDLNLKYIWDFGDGSSSEQIIKKHSYNEEGVYRVFLTVLDSEGANNTSEQIIYVGHNQKNTKTQKPENNDDFSFSLPLNEVRNMFKGDKVKVKGVVSVEPGVLGSQIFYIAGSGIQIYSYKKDFPPLAVGDLIEISGELSESGGESRIKTKTAGDIKTIQKSVGEPKPHLMTTGEIGEDSEGYLVKISGEVIEIRGSNIYIDDGNDEAKVYIKKSTGIDLNKLNVKEGDRLTVVGIVSQTASGYRVLPRYLSDIVKGAVLGEKTQRPENSNGTLKQENNSNNKFFFISKEGIRGWHGSKINKYLIAIAIFFIALSGWLGWQYFKLKKNGWQIIEK